MIIEGKIVKGFGRAKTFIKMMNDAFYEKTNINLYPGTLNLELDENYDVKPDFLIKKEEYGGSFDVQIQKCKLFEKEAYIVRSEKNTKTNRRLY